jgi:hypothetical protein
MVDARDVQGLGIGRDFDALQRIDSWLFGCYKIENRIDRRKYVPASGILLEGRALDGPPIQEVRKRRVECRDRGSSL